MAVRPLLQVGGLTSRQGVASARAYEYRRALDRIERPTDQDRRHCGRPAGCLHHAGGRRQALCGLQKGKRGKRVRQANISVVSCAGMEGGPSSCAYGSSSREPMDRRRTRSEAGHRSLPRPGRKPTRSPRSPGTGEPHLGAPPHSSASSGTSGPSTFSREISPGRTAGQPTGPMQYSCGTPRPARRAIGRSTTTRGRCSPRSRRT